MVSAPQRINLSNAADRSLWNEWSNQLEEEVLNSLLNAKHLKVSLANIARSQGVPMQVVEDMAQKLCLSTFHVDLDEKEFQDAVKTVEDIEKIKDPGLREFKLSKAARSFGLTKRSLMDAYNKAVCGRAAMQIRHISQFKKEFQKQIDWMVQGWIPKGVTILLHAFGGVGKTLLVYDILAHVLAGKNWNGYQVEKGDALLVQVDEPELVTAERLDIRGIADDAPLFVLNDWAVEQIHRLEAHIAEKPPKLLIIDSITAINRNTIFSENDTEYARPILQIRDMARRYGCTVLLIHHSNAEGRSRGTKAIHNSVDEVWALSQVQGCDDRLLTIEKCRLGRAPGRYRFAFEEDFSFKFLGEQRGEEFDADDPTIETKIRLWLAESAQLGIAFAPVEVAERCGVNEHTCRKALYELWSKGLVHRKRPPRSPAYLYFVPKGDQGDRKVITNDHLDDHLSITSEPNEIKGFEKGDRGDRGDRVKNEKFQREKNQKNDDHLDHLDHLSAESIDLASSKGDRKGDRQGDRQVISDHPAITLDHPPETAESVDTPSSEPQKQGDRQSDRRSITCCRTLQKGQVIEVFHKNRWITARFMAIGQMRLSPLSRSLEESIRAVIGKRSAFVTVDCVRLPENDLD